MFHNQYINRVLTIIRQSVELMPLPVFIGFEPTEDESIVGSASIYIGDKLSMPPTVKDVFELKRLEGVSYELREFMHFLHLFPARVVLPTNGSVVDLTYLYQHFREQGGDILTANSEIEEMTLADYAKRQVIHVLTRA